MTIPLSGANYVMPREKRPARPPQEKPKSATENQVLSNTPIVNAEKQQTQQITTGQNNTPQNNTSLGQDALRATQESILALQKMQEQTAKLHQQYLLGQETAQQTIAQLLQQQQALLGVESTTIPSIVPVAQTQETTPVQLAAEAPVAAPQPIEETRPAVEIVETEKAVHADEEVHSILLDVVAEKTGYPLEMLSLDMSLDTMAATAPQTITQNAPVDKDSSSNNGSALNTDLLASVLLEVVGDKTGYPMDMLNLDMSLDTDLGIDSIKRVEILSALQEKLPEAPMVSPEDLGNLQTLQQIVDFLSAGSTSVSETI
jgi:acyl carrier protein